MALSTLYYYKERNRLFQEQKVKYRLEFLECQRLQKLLKDGSECEMKVIEEIKGLGSVYKEISIVFSIFIIMILPMGYLLAMMSLRPIRESVETIDSFINGIIHDINTPLSVIKVNAQSMTQQLESQRLLNQNSRVLQGISEIESLEEQLLFSLKADRYDLNITQFDLETLLKERSDYWNEIRPTVHVKVALKPLHVNADQAIFMRMIDNIVLNAIKFSPRHSEVFIVLEGSKLSVKDQGCGIKEPKKVFTKYYREAGTTKGLGLGLFIVHSVAQLHEIGIELVSKLNVGTTVILELEKIKGRQ